MSTERISTNCPDFVNESSQLLTVLMPEKMTWRVLELRNNGNNSEWHFATFVRNNTYMQNKNGQYIVEFLGRLHTMTTNLS